MKAEDMKGVIVNADGVTKMVLVEPGVLTNPEEVVIRNGDFIEVTYTVTDFADEGGMQ